MSITTQVDRIIAILATDSDIVSVTRGTVHTINSTPSFFVITGDATHSFPSSDMKMTERSFSIFGCIKAVEAGREFDAEEAVEAWFDTIEALFDDRPGLWLASNADALAGVQDAKLISDTGFGVITVGGANFAGSEWILRITSYKELSPGA